MDVCDDGPATTDTGGLHTGSWMIYTLRSIKRFSADNKKLNAGADVCNGGIEQVERHVLEKHCQVRTMESSRKEGIKYPPFSGYVCMSWTWICVFSHCVPVSILYATKTPPKP